MTKPTSRKIIYVLVLAGLVQGTRSGSVTIQQPPKELPVLTNQTRVNLKYQIRKDAGWQDVSLRSGETEIVAPGCIRYSTGSPPRAVYYILFRSERYAFVAEEHEVRMVYNEANGKRSLNPSDPLDSACSFK
jgi:hypothetical protein